MTSFIVGYLILSIIFLPLAIGLGRAAAEGDRQQRHESE